jgi:hypothetical protein
MAKRFTDTDLWDKEWFMKLSCKQKCLVKLIRDKCDLSGVWSPNWLIVATYLGEQATEAELLDIDEGRQFIKISGGKIFCIGFVSFQYGELSEKSPVHRKIINLLVNHKIDYKHPINTPEEEVEEEEEETEEEKEEEPPKKRKKKEVKKPEPIQIVYPFVSDQFIGSWDLWKNYKKAEHNFKYKSEISEQAALKELGEMANGDEDKAIKIIHQSISKAWSGLFELKENGKQGNTKGQSRTTDRTARAAELYKKYGGELGEQKPGPV